MSAFKQGFDNYLNLCGADLGAQIGNEYVGSVQKEIDRLVKMMNEPKRKVDKVDIAHLQGFVAEWWHDGTYNIDAAVKGNKIRTDGVSFTTDGFTDCTAKHDRSFTTGYATVYVAVADSF